MFAAEAASGKGGPGAAPLTVAFVALGLGLAGLLVSASVLGLGRRRARSRAGGHR